MDSICRWVALVALASLAACSGGGGDPPLPTATISASATVIQGGDSSTLTWSSTNATTCQASDGWTGALATAGTQNTGAVTSATTYSITCTGAGGTSTAATVTVNIVPTATLSANPLTVSPGGSSTLTWTSANATACQASDGWSGSLPTSGSQSTGPLNTNTSFSITCSGPGGDSAVSTVSVASAAPTVTLSANPTTVALGASSILTWSSANATACTASGGWSGTQAVSGSTSTGPLNANTSFSISCSGPGGNSTVSTVSVTIAAPSVTLSANPATVALGASSTLTWSSLNATACTASGGWSGAQAVSGSKSTGALNANTSFGIMCTGPGGTSPVSSVSVAIAAPSVTLSANPTTVALGANSTLTWSSANATACTASGGWSGAQAVSGSQSTGALNANTSFDIMCTGPGGASPVSSISVAIAAPTVTLSANPTTVALGASSTLTWSSANATACSASGSWSGAQAASGSQSTGAISANSTYALQCAGPGGTSSPASVTVYITSGTLSPKLATITLTETAQFTATFTGGGAATWSVDGIANGNASVGTISGTGLYSAGTAAGRHTILAVDVADASQSATGIAAVTDLAGVLTYHNNLARNGANTQEYALLPGNVSAATFGKLTSCWADGAIYTQPLWIPHVTIGGTVHNVVLVATEHDGLFAFDADAVPCVTLWSVGLIDAAHGAAAPGEIPVPTSKVGTGYADISPEIGVTGTAVIDASTNTVYVASKSMDSAQTTYFTRLHAIDLTTGLERTGSPMLITGVVPGTASGSSTVAFDSHQQLQRPALAYANGNVYVSFGSHEDSTPWFGWVFSYSYSGTGFAQQAIFNTAPNAKGAGIWMGGGGPAVDGAGSLFLVTGNGTFDAANASAPNNDYGDSLLSLSPSLIVNQYYTPSNQLSDDQNDKDFGSGGSTMLADLPAGSTYRHALVCGGKDGALLVLNRDALGGYDGPIIQSIALGHALFATAAFWNNTMYVTSASSPLRAYALNTSTAQFAAATASSHTFGFPGATSSVSAAGTQNGIVWSIDSHGYCTPYAQGCGPAVLYAHDAGNLATELWNSSALAANAAGNAVKFTVPTVANGHVYVGTRGNNVGGAMGSTSTPGELEIYGLLP